MHFNPLSLCISWAENILLEERDLVLSTQTDILRTCFLESDLCGQPPFPPPTGPSNLIAWNVLIIIHCLQGAAQMSVSQLAGYWGSRSRLPGCQDVFFGRSPLP